MAGLTTYAVHGRRSHKMKQTQNTRVVSGGRRGGSILAGERKGSGSHSGEWSGSGVLSGATEKATAVTNCTWATLGQKENTETVAKQKQLSSAGLDSMRGARARKIT